MTDKILAPLMSVAEKLYDNIIDWWWAWLCGLCLVLLYFVFQIAGWRMPFIG